MFVLAFGIGELNAVNCKCLKHSSLIILMILSYVPETLTLLPYHLRRLLYIILLYLSVLTNDIYEIVLKEL